MIARLPDKKTQDRCFVCAWRGLITGVFVAIGFSLVAFLIFNGLIKNDFFKTHALISNKVLEEKVSKKDLAKINELREKYYLLTTNEMLEINIAYYDTIIQMFLALIAIMGVLAFIYVKSVSEAKAKASIKEFFDIYTKSIDFHKDVRRWVDDATNETLNKFDEFRSTYENKYAKLLVKIERLEGIKEEKDSDIPVVDELESNQEGTS